MPRIAPTVRSAAASRSRGLLKLGRASAAVFGRRSRRRRLGSSSSSSAPSSSSASSSASASSSSSSHSSSSGSSSGRFFAGGLRISGISTPPTKPGTLSAKPKGPLPSPRSTRHQSGSEPLGPSSSVPARCGGDGRKSS
ncbi:hypothetical protein E2651_29215, partial [Streptomyces sp. MZ04]